MFVLIEVLTHIITNNKVMSTCNILKITDRIFTNRIVFYMIRFDYINLELSTLLLAKNISDIMEKHYRV